MTQPEQSATVTRPLGQDVTANPSAPHGVAADSLSEHWRTVYDARRPLASKPFRSVCYAPFTTLEFTVNGEVVACWRSASYVLGRIGEETLDEIWRGPKIAALREVLKQYRFLDSCRWCQWQIQTGDVTGVQANRYDFLDVDADAQWPKQFYFSIDSTCNFACIMCCGDVSSTFRVRIDGLPPKPPIYTDAFFEQLDPYLPRLQAACFFGGEPFLGRGNYRIWDRMIALKAKATLHINTNGSVFNERVRHYLDALNIGTIAVSVDGFTKETFERVRRFGNFEQVLANTEAFAAYCRERGKHFSLAVCLLRQNYQELPRLYELTERLGGFVSLNLVTNPAEYSVYALPEPERLHIRDYLEQAFRGMEQNLSQANQLSFRGMIDTLSGSSKEDITNAGSNDA